MKKVYVAGPLSASEPADYIFNVSEMLSYATDFWAQGIAVFCPCLDILLGMMSTRRHSYEDYFLCSLEWLKVSDAMFIIGDSPGVLREKEVAEELGIPIFRSITALMNWVRGEEAGDK